MSERNHDSEVIIKSELESDFDIENNEELDLF